MHWSANILLRVVAFVVGSILVGLAVLLREDEEGRIHNRLEELWIRIDDRATLGESRTIAFLQQMADTVERWFDRAFGKRLFSFRMVIISGCLSFSSAMLEAELLGLLGSTAPAFKQIASFLMMLFAVAGIVPMLFREKWVLALSGAFLCTVFALAVLTAFRTGSPERVALPTSIALLLAVMSDWAYIMAVRKFLRVSAGNRKYTVAALLATAAVIVYAFSPVVINWTAHSYSPSGVESQWARFLLLCVAFALYSNFFGGIAALLVFVVIGSALLHRAFWPMLSRPVYALHRHRVVSNHKLLFAAGVMLLAYAVPGLMWLSKLK